MIQLATSQDYSGRSVQKLREVVQDLSHLHTVLALCLFLPIISHFSRYAAPGNSADEIQAIWHRTDEYQNSFLIPSSSPTNQTLQATLKASNEAGLPDSSVSPAQGKFFGLVAKSIGARRVLEVGTLGGYSAMWFALNLPSTAESKVVTLEKDEHRASVAASNINNAGLSDKITILVGPAAQSLEKMVSEGATFDMMFLDADKKDSVEYYGYAKRLVRKGGVIIFDNAVYNGIISDPSFQDGWSQGIRDLLKLMKDEGETEVEGTIVGTAGERGYDGFLYAVRK